MILNFKEFKKLNDKVDNLLKSMKTWTLKP